MSGLSQPWVEAVIFGHKDRAAETNTVLFAFLKRLLQRCANIVDRLFARINLLTH